MKRSADPNPHEISGADLAPKMVTFYRVADREGNVKFRRDHLLLEQVDAGLDGTTVGCRAGIHFRTDKGSVCYWTGGRVWVKDDE